MVTFTVNYRTGGRDHYSWHQTNIATKNRADANAEALKLQSQGYPVLVIATTCKGVL